ncbi:MAG: acyl transferase [Cryomorphaceae bacterium]|jgi:hypothetical protein|nr:acyl transferase [Cryomorphaceae bacterium]
MERNELLEQKIFSIRSKEDFNRTALEVFYFQYEHCSIYRSFAEHLNKTAPSEVTEIPFLPISFFKSHRVSVAQTHEAHFKSSGTTSVERSSHFVFSKDVYTRSFKQFYRDAIGNPENQIILALLPNYLEQGDSSLVFMVNELIESTKDEASGFVLGDLDELKMRYDLGTSRGKQVVIFGVSYALLDLAEAKLDLSAALIIETGGMKGRRKELLKEELHQIICAGTGAPFVFSEYGMTELLSQGYSNQNGYFRFPNWVNILLRDVNDPLHYLSEKSTGGINVIDLANLYSCSFIATQDLGVFEAEGLKLMGRYDHSDIRGCNLLVQ